MENCGLNVNYAKERAILLPGRMPGYKRSDMQLLPSRKVHSTINGIIAVGENFTKYGALQKNCHQVHKTSHKQFVRETIQ